MTINYKELDLKAGIEIHQRLNTKTKLFCRCEAKIQDIKPKKKITRKQHPVLSELGEKDIATEYEFLRDREFVYLLYPNVCEVEIDEAPPLPLNEEALKIGLLICRIFNCKIPDEIHIMRKIITDGSNPTSFQRTAIIGFDGYLNYKGKKIKIKEINLEEESAGLVKEEKNKVYFRLDRLGIPLVEISTGLLSGFSPKEIQEIAFLIGMNLRLTKKVQRGIGSIRQDVNVSIKNGARVEIKGLQRIEDIPKVIDLEIERQLKLKKIRAEILRKGKKIQLKVFDFTDFFKNSNSQLIRKILTTKRIYGFVLPGFAGFLNEKISGEKTLGKEIADYAKAFGLGGIIHSDEDLNKYGLTEEFKTLREKIGLRDDDALIIIGEHDGKISRFILEKIKRFVENGLEEETRAVNEDCTTRFLRPLPGSARLYPETDIPPIKITKEILMEIKKQKILSFEEKIKNLEKMGLKEEIALQLLKSNYLEIFENIIDKFKLNPKLVATFFTNILKDVKREGFDIENLSNEKILEIFNFLSRKKLAKEALKDVVIYLIKNPNKGVKNAIDDLGLSISLEEAEKTIKEIIDQFKHLRKEKIFGIVMSKLRGKLEVQKIKEIFNKLYQKES